MQYFVYSRAGFVGLFACFFEEVHKQFDGLLRVVGQPMGGRQVENVSCIAFIVVVVNNAVQQVDGGFGSALLQLG